MKKVFITGANRGLGLGLTRHMLVRGHRVWAACRQPESASELVSLKSDYADRLTIVACDVTDEASVLAAAAKVDEESETLDWLVNNAGQGGLEDLDSFDAERALALFSANSIAPFLVARAFRKLLGLGDNPLIVQMSSRLGSISERESEFGRWVDGYVYPATKAALNMMSRQLWKDLKPEGITVVVQSPGWVRTDMGGEAAPLDVDTATLSMVEVWEKLGPEDGGRYLTETGGDLPWG